jgi:hypothetical protein
MSESDQEKDGVEAVEPKRKINDPLTGRGAEAPRMPWQPQRPSPESSRPEADETGGGDEGPVLP